VAKAKILRRTEDVVLRKPAPNVGHAFDLLASMPEHFMKGGRKDRAPQKRAERF